MADKPVIHDTGRSMTNAEARRRYAAALERGTLSEIAQCERDCIATYEAERASTEQVEAIERVPGTKVTSYNLGPVSPNDVLAVQICGPMSDTVLNQAITCMKRLMPDQRIVFIRGDIQFYWLRAPEATDGAGA